MSYSYTYTEVIAAAAILLPLAWITAILRCWVKRFVVKAFGADDWLMLMALLLFTVNVSMSFVMANWEFGHPVEDFEEHQLSQVLRVGF
jgi:Kef-type K+ transport system membrane component KefB